MKKSNSVSYQNFPLSYKSQNIAVSKPSSIFHNEKIKLNHDTSPFNKKYSIPISLNNSPQSTHSKLIHKTGVRTGTIQEPIRSSKNFSNPHNENLKGEKTEDLKYTQNKNLKKQPPRANYFMLKPRNGDIFKPLERINVRSPAISPEKLQEIYNHQNMLHESNSKPNLYPEEAKTNGKTVGTPNESSSIVPSGSNFALPGGSARSGENVSNTNKKVNPKFINSKAPQKLHAAKIAWQNDQQAQDQHNLNININNNFNSNNININIINKKDENKNPPFEFGKINNNYPRTTNEEKLSYIEKIYQEKKKTFLTSSLPKIDYTQNEKSDTQKSWKQSINSQESSPNTSEGKTTPIINQTHLLQKPGKNVRHKQALSLNLPNSQNNPSQSSLNSQFHKKNPTPDRKSTQIRTTANTPTGGSSNLSKISLQFQLQNGSATTSHHHAPSSSLGNLDYKAPESERNKTSYSSYLSNPINSKKIQQIASQQKKKTKNGLSPKAKKPKLFFQQPKSKIFMKKKESGNNHIFPPHSAKEGSTMPATPSGSSTSSGTIFKNRSSSVGYPNLTPKSTSSSGGDSSTHNKKVMRKQLADPVEKYAFRTRTGYIPTKPQKTNQDVQFVLKNFANIKNVWFCGVCDGHGVNGHFASDHVKKYLPTNLELVDYLLQKKCSTVKQAAVEGGKAKQSSYEDLLESIDTCLAHGSALLSTNQMAKYGVITEAFLKTNMDIQNRSFDISYSGSTAVTILITGNRLICANVGDSRAVLASYKKPSDIKGITLSEEFLKLNQDEKLWVAVPLSRDHKPDESMEFRRIVANRGRIEPFREPNGDPIGPARVWLKNENVPGLAMSRSIGDKVASTVGVISEPELFETELTEDDKFIVIASDGIWEFLPNEEVVEMITPFWKKGDPDGACEKLVKEAVAHWQQEDEVIDDITIVVIFLNVKTGVNS